MQGLIDYLYDVFIRRFDLWMAFGLAAQLMFTGRFLVQWIASERAGRSVVPLAFWYFSIGGGMMTLIYGLVKREPIIIVGQLFANLVYIRNVVLVKRGRKAGGELPARDP